MIIGSEFSDQYRHFLIEIVKYSRKDTSHKIPVTLINSDLNLDRTVVKNLLEYLQELGYIHIETIGGPFLYGHVTITQAGLRKYHEISD